MNKIIRRVATVVAVVVGGFLTFRLLDLLMAWFLYSWFFQTIRSLAGIPDTLNGAASIWLTVVTLLLLPTFLSVLFWKRDVKKVLIIVSAVSVWLVIVYFMSLPQEGRFFNTQTGSPMYRYSLTPEGKIEFFPLGYNFHPRYGTKLEPVTPEVVKEMDRKAAEAKAKAEQAEATKYVAAHPPAPVIIKVGKTPSMHPFGADGCYKTDLGYEAKWSPDKGAMRVYDPAGGSHVERLGTKSPISAFGPGRWGFCGESPDAAAGVVIWE